MSEGTNGGKERAYRALVESEELHRATLSSISDAVFLTDNEGRFTYICPNVDVIVGRHRSNGG
jgi:PAS domain-containing protein